MKKKIIIITLILIISISIVKLYQTYAISSSVIGNNDNYTVNLNGNTSVVVPANGNKTVYYKIRNTNNGTVQYSVGYKSTNTIVKVYSDSDNNATGLINKEENKFIKLYLENSSSSSETVYLTTIFGYENGGNLIVPDGYYLVTKFYSRNEGAAQKIVKLYEQASKTDVINNDITYQYDTTNNLMEDVGGNIRYYGEKPNNYIYFNCSDYANQTSSTCEKWRIVGVFNGKVKIMRDGIIGEYSYDNKDTTTGASSVSGSNDWTNARLMKLLNPSSYYTLDNNDNGNGQSLYWNSENGKCFAGQNNGLVDCNFTSIGIKNEETRNMISETTYSLKSYQKKYSNLETPFTDIMYGIETSKGIMYNENMKSTWKGKIALPYASDYGYASDFRLCNKKLSEYAENSDCYLKNWMYSIFTADGNWLINPNATNDHDVLSVFRYHKPVVHQGKVWYFTEYIGIVYENRTASEVKGIAPTLFLNKDIDISTGNGTSDNPYQLKIENNQQYTITYNANGGNGAPSNQTKKHGENITLSSVKPTKTGYTFTGWNTSSNGSGTSYSSGGTYSNNSNVTLYAQWKVNTYTITYNANGGSWAPSNQTKKHGENITLSSVKPTKPGYTFTGWNTSSNGSGTSYSSGGTYSNNSNVTLYAQWKANTYTITYNANGGSGAPSNQTKKHGENITLSSVKPTKTGYTFTGWNTYSNGSGTSYSSGGTYSNNSNVTLYAQWQSVSSYTVTVYLQGELINNYTVVPGNNLNTRFGVDSEEPFRYGNCTNGASITGSVSRVNNMSVATINVTNITSDTVCNLYYTLI